MTINRQWTLRSRPVGPLRESDFELVEAEVPEPGEGEIVVHLQWFSMDPSMRGYLVEAESYMNPVPLGGVIRGRGVGEVVASKDPALPVGSQVQGMFGWADYVLARSGDDQLSRIQLIPEGVEPRHTIGAVGPPGLTAYIGMLDIGEFQEGMTVLVSGAAGATGSVAAQIARLSGASKVVGIAGGEAKCRWLREEARLDGAIDYKSEDLAERLGKEFPNGVDLFFDNVGGEILETVLLAMAPRGRVVLCGAISAYQREDMPPGPRTLMASILKELTIKGFVYFAHPERIPAAREALTQWVASGEMAVAEDIQEGFENAPRTLMRLFEGKNLGKQLLKIR